MSALATAAFLLFGVVAFCGCIALLAWVCNALYDRFTR